MGVSPLSLLVLSIAVLLLVLVLVLVLVIVIVIVIEDVTSPDHIPPPSNSKLKPDRAPSQVGRIESAKIRQRIANQLATANAPLPETGYPYSKAP